MYISEEAPAERQKALNFFLPGIKGHGESGGEVCGELHIRASTYELQKRLLRLYVCTCMYLEAVLIIKL